MDQRQLARTQAAARVVAGSTLALAPRFGARLVLGDRTEPSPGLSWFVRALGIRDLLLGFGAIDALDNNQAAASWVQVGAMADLGDAAMTILAFGDLPWRSRIGLLAMGVGSAIVGFRAAATLD